MRYVVAYDITNDKRRKKISDLLEGYGVRVNYSVFEVELNKTKLNELLYEIELKNLLNKKYDSLRFYQQCENCVANSFELSNMANPFDKISYELF